MQLIEAQEWLRGERSMANEYRSAPGEWVDRESALARADAAMTEQAYWIVRAHREGLVNAQQDRCSYHRPAHSNGVVRPPDPPDWCVLPAGHDGEHRMWSTARHG